MGVTLSRTAGPSTTGASPGAKRCCGAETQPASTATAAAAAVPDACGSKEKRGVCMVRALFN
jgi:hypothetical protein